MKVVISQEEYMSQLLFSCPRRRPWSPRHGGSRFAETLCPLHLDKRTFPCCGSEGRGSCSEGATKRSKWDRYRRSSRLTIDPPNAISEWSNQNGDCRLKSRDPGSRWRASSWAFDNGGF
ncbi:apolipoprotein L1 isoform X1 [Piliocolobus tephrosceles]|uniref:apolipoprotein L1 isoform X1 n=1 Tax=Piliocolobus tephrosceles TaxID=591936 RepID=UPI000E6B4AC5|nr:apolipoprotein L1 isoform X1 [Piliocolobus tephrosceles]